jgi:hypothetical protein
MGEQNNHEENILNELSHFVTLLVPAKRKTTPKVFRIAVLMKGNFLLFKEMWLKLKF